MLRNVPNPLHRMCEIVKHEEGKIEKIWDEPHDSPQTIAWKQTKDSNKEYFWDNIWFAADHRDALERKTVWLF